MSDTSAKIRGKGLEHTGVTAEHANHMYANVGSHYVGVVDIKVKRRGEDDDGNRYVELAIESIELAPINDTVGTAEHIRRLTRALHYERGLAVNGGDQLPLEGTGEEPTVEQVRAAGTAYEGELQDPDLDEDDEESDGDRELDDEDDVDDEDFNEGNETEPHAFDGQPGYVCTICDQTDDADIHAGDQTRPDVDDDQPQPDDETYEPHPFVLSAGGVCKTCAGPEQWGVHNTTGTPKRTPVAIANPFDPTSAA